MTSPRSSVTGLLLAAGVGRRMGAPKALLRAPDGQTWVARAVRVLLDGGCEGVGVVLGARAEEVEAALVHDVAGERVDIVAAPDWQQGMGASLRRGLEALEATDTAAVLVHLVDTPDVGAEVVARLLAAAGDGRLDDSLARAAYRGVPGHPVLIGRSHWAGVMATAAGDRGARVYLAERPVELVECGDLAGGHDADRPEDLLPR